MTLDEGMPDVLLTNVSLSLSPWEGERQSGRMEEEKGVRIGGLTI